MLIKYKQIQVNTGKCHICEKEFLSWNDYYRTLAEWNRDFARALLSGDTTKPLWFYTEHFE